ncbi:MAG: hypothetical protein A2W90_14375 [Bacteroidetes bacterium GWF2_42_66]|nr:MAG: hypothetical protein A2W92_15770 [Bacteroidetes bacterium GWA2_42_15]OFX99118.1 MAG: hypothetical protein A2W89_06885 [Bacteroidetes bacterium GWE2_42_39]OFY46713.1 MAG: hypothetical protein A2W90_14375 [Bacteroidetes bacterium GWF2_42_66]
MFVTQPSLSSGNIVRNKVNPDTHVSGGNFSSGNETARKFGVHEITLQTNKVAANPFGVGCRVVFYAPSGKQWQINAFYDGGATWRARVYVNEAGDWTWKSVCKENSGLDKLKGDFQAEGSDLRGMLHKAPGNPKQWKTDDGQWFLNINDTGYLLFNRNEKLWKEYIEDLSKLGVTSVRAGSLGGETWDKNAEINELLQKAYPDCAGFTMDNYPWDENDNSKMNLDRFQTTDERLVWMLDNYPDMYIQFILFGMQTWGTDDSGQLWKAVPQDIRNKTMKYMIARWSAFPQLFYLIANDMHCSEKYPNNQAYVREVGRYFAANDPWRHLISTGPNRNQVFPFTGNEDLDWVSYIHIEDMFALDARKAELYEPYPLHVFMGEDWYEHTRLDRSKDYLYNPEYFYRWLFWSWTLSGGSANYGGRWAKIHPYFSTDTLLYVEPLGGLERGDLQPKGEWNEGATAKTFVHAKYNAQLKGLNSVKYITGFFSDRKIDLAEFVPDHRLITDLNQREEKGYQKLMRKGYEEFIIYDPNALCGGNNTLIDKNKTVHLRVDFGEANKTYTVGWYCPLNGEIVDGGSMKCTGKVEFKAPWKGIDIVLHLREKR